MSGSGAPAEQAARTWRVGRYTVRLTVQRLPDSPMSARIEWLPRLPKRLSAEDLGVYRTGRNDALRQISVELGVNVALVEL